MELPYMNKLNNISNFFVKHISYFPINKCQLSTRFLNKIMGFEEIAGTYTKKGVKEFWHSWSFDKTNNIYIDLTAYQFKWDLFVESPREITILPTNTNILTPIQEYTIKHKSLKDTQIFWDLMQGKTVLELVNEYNKHN